MVGNVPKRKYAVNFPLLRRLAEIGLTDKQIAYALSIPERTWEEYIAKDKKIRAVLREAKKNPNKAVENALFQNALGYDAIEWEEEIVYNDLGVEIARPLKRKIKHMRGDTKAQLAWLTNRNPERWKNQQTVNLRGTLTMRDRAELANKGDEEE